MDRIFKTSKQYIFEDTVNITPGERQISSNDFQKKDTKSIPLLTSRERIIFKGGKKIKEIVFSRNDIAIENLSNPKFREALNAQQAITKKRIEDFFKKTENNLKFDFALHNITTNYKISRPFTQDEEIKIKESLKNIAMLEEKLNPLEFKRNQLRNEMNTLWLDVRKLKSEGNINEANLKTVEANKHKNSIAELEKEITTLGNNIFEYEKEIEQIKTDTNYFVPYFNANNFIDVMVKENKLLSAYNPLKKYQSETSTDDEISMETKSSHDKRSGSESENINSFASTLKTQNSEQTSLKNSHRNSNKPKPLPKIPKKHNQPSNNILKSNSQKNNQIQPAHSTATNDDLASPKNIRDKSAYEAETNLNTSAIPSGAQNSSSPTLKNTSTDADN